MSHELQLPNDIEQCHALILQRDALVDEVNMTNQSLASDLEKAKFEIEQLKRYIYGQRSERHSEDDSQLPLFDDAAEPTAEPEDDSEVIEEEITYRRRKRSKSDRFLKICREK